MALPSYGTHDPRGWMGDPRRGAALGRHEYHSTPDFAGKLVLRRIRLVDYDYDVNGTYWGGGTPLFWVASKDCEVDYVLRADDRDSAKEMVRQRYPQARFYR